METKAEKTVLVYASGFRVTETESGVEYRSLSPEELKAAIPEFSIEAAGFCDTALDPITGVLYCKSVNCTGTCVKKEPDPGLIYCICE